MGWFEDQIKQRIEYDDGAFQEAFVKMTGAIMGEKVTAALENDRQRTRNAMDAGQALYSKEGTGVYGK